jgi:hypothetical protein
MTEAQCATRALRRSSPCSTARSGGPWRLCGGRSLRHARSMRASERGRGRRRIERGGQLLERLEREKGRNQHSERNVTGHTKLETAIKGAGLSTQEARIMVNVARVPEGMFERMVERTPPDAAPVARTWRARAFRSRCASSRSRRRTFRHSSAQPTTDRAHRQSAPQPQQPAVMLQPMEVL